MTIRRSSVGSTAVRSCAVDGRCGVVAFSLTIALAFGSSWECAAQYAAALPPPSPTPASLTAFDRPISALRASIALPAAESPPNSAAAHLDQEGVRYQVSGLGRGWGLQPFEWEASAVRHYPLYFEEPNLERLGYYYGWPCDGRVRRAMFCNVTEYMSTVHDDSPIKQWYFDVQCRLDNSEPHLQILQPMVSAAHFFGRVPMLPYMWGSCCPHDEVYEFGQDRPGSPVPFRKYYMPLSLKGAFYEGAAATGIAYIIP